MADTLIFNLARRLKRRWSKEGMAALSQAEVDEINAVLADWKKAVGSPPASDRPVLSARLGPPEPHSVVGGAVAAPAGQFKLGPTSLKRMEGVHPDLVKVVQRAIQLTPIDFTVLEGMRTLARQRQLVASGASQTMNSRHLTGHAVDIAPLLDGKVSWDWPLYHKLAPAVKQAAAELGVPVEWGGDWKSFKDGPHWQLPFGRYPK